MNYSYTQKFKLAVINFNTGQNIEVIPSLLFLLEKQEHQVDIDSLMETKMKMPQVKMNIWVIIQVIHCELCMNCSHVSY